MNTIRAYSQWNDGSWLAFYLPGYTSRPQAVRDAKGQPVRYLTSEKAHIAACEALCADLNRIEAMRLEPDQIKPCPKVWEPRSAAGRKRWAEQRLREAMREAAE